MVLITGSRGMIGKRLFPRIFDAKGIDIRDGNNLLTCELPRNVDLIYHLAAQTSVEASWHDPLHDLDNIRITARLVNEYPNTKIIYASSAAAQEPISSPYGFSKWASGEYLKRFHLRTVLCVFPNIYGEIGGKSVVDIFKETDDVTVYGDGLQTRDYVHVDDIVEGLLKAKDWIPGEYSLGSEHATSVLKLAKKKKVTFAPARQEARESILLNTTPNWKSKIKVMDYLYA